MKRFLVIALAMLAATTAAVADDHRRIEVSAGFGRFETLGFGDLTPTPVRVRDQAGPCGAISYFWTDHISTSLRVFATRLSAYAPGPGTGSQTVETLKALPVSGLFRLHAASRSAFVPYAGVGAEYLRFHGARLSGLNPGDFASIGQPDHLTFITNAGLDYRIDRRWLWNVDVQYGPSRSTIEINRQTPHTDTIHADFHFMTVSASIGYSF